MHTFKRSVTIANKQTTKHLVTIHSCVVYFTQLCPLTRKKGSRRRIWRVLFLLIFLVIEKGKK